MQPVVGLPVITGKPAVNQGIFIALTAITVAVVIWSVRSLPPAERGRRLCTSGAFAWFRHPLYAAFLTFFNFGLAFQLDNWIFLVWAVVQHPVWHLNIRYEEQLVRDHFGAEYDDYAHQTGRFVPRFW